MKTTCRYYLFILFLSILPLISIFSTPLLFHSHDGYVHLARIAAFTKAIQDKEFPVRWAGDLNFGYGMPLFNFIYQVPYALASLFVFFGVGLVNAFKVTIALSYILSGIFMFAFGREFFKDNRIALFLAVFYQFAPFRLIELLVRGSFGEVYTYAFVPLVLWGIARFNRKQTFSNFLLISVSSALLILSHNALSLVFFGFCFGFLLVLNSGKKVMIQSSAALGVGLTVSLFYWLPAIVEHKYTYGDLFMKNLYLQHFPPLLNFFIPNFTNAVSLQTKGISVQIGLFHVLVIVLAIMVLFKKTTDSLLKKIFAGNIVMLVITLILMQPVSIPVWAHLSLLRQFQFSWRLLGIISLCSAFLSVSFFSLSISKNNSWYIAVLVLVVLSTVFYWKPPLGYDRINEQYYWHYPYTSTYFGETDVIWSAGPEKSYPPHRVEFISGSGQISQFRRNTHMQLFLVSTQKPSTLVDHLEYFPGWRVYVNGVSVPVQFQDPTWRGQMIFSIPQGTSSVLVTFGETPLRLAADCISAASALLLVCLGVYTIRKSYEKNRM